MVQFVQYRLFATMYVALRRASLAVLVGAVPLLPNVITPAHADDQPNRIIIEYVPPQDPAHQSMYEWLREHQVLEKSKEPFSPFRLPTDLTLRLKGCDGKVNAWYRRWSVTICYEYLEDIRQNMPTEQAPGGSLRQTQSWVNISTCWRTKWVTLCSTC
jgi:hypothetical protein